MFRVKDTRGFTFIELLVVLAIIGVIAAIVMVVLSDSRQSGRDAGRKVQTQEILKAIEFMYSDTGNYPTVASGGVPLTNAGLQSQIIGSGSGLYLKRVPEEPERFHYCVASDRRSMMLAVNTEEDYGGSEYCRITRGMGTTPSGFGCTAWMNTNATENCSSRF